MLTPATIVLKNGKDHSLRRRHPWVFSGAIARLRGDAGEGDAARVEAADGELLGVGHFSGGGSIAVRMLDFGTESELPTPDFWCGSCGNAYAVAPAPGPRPARPIPTCSAWCTPRATACPASSSTCTATWPWCRPTA
ncbi:MAG: hypothetical protein WKG07_24135 [Hymenobacter sp.]